VAAAVLIGCGGPEEAPRAARLIASPKGLVEHSAEFEQRIYNPTEGVYVAVGYGLSNSIMIEGDTGVVIVDTTESLESGRVVREAFRKLVDKPVRAIVYTHNHVDHVMGALAFVDDPENPPAVYAHRSTAAYINRIISVVRPTITHRSMQMFGNYLSDDQFINCGIGPRLHSGVGGGTAALMWPTHVFDDELNVNVAGVQMKLVHAPGETQDQLFVWLPDKKTLLPGDNFYRAFPNLYTIRGTAYRDVMEWARSLDLMRRLRPEFLVPSHSRPLEGAPHIARQLLDYRDAIQYVHDQSIRGINRGLTPDELVEFVKLPPHLAENPWLQEYYGTVEWSVRSIFAGYLGWFDGNTSTLSPATPDERARAMAALASGATSLQAASREALDAGHAAWAAELADHMLRLEGDDAFDAAAKILKAEALEALAATQVSPNGRNFYLTQAGMLRGEIVPNANPTLEATDEMIYGFPLFDMMSALPVRLDAKKSADVDRVVGFVFPDVDEKIMLHIRRGVAEVQPFFFAEPGVTVTVDSRVWKDILAQRINPVAAFASGKIEVEGGTVELLSFLALFDRG
jgi:alkyl sulfatase BDS1-like metallo-beta-lactamase superfamily hydrolase